MVGGVEDDEESKRMSRYERSLGEYVEGLDVSIAVNDETGLLEPSPTGTKYHWTIDVIMLSYV